MNERIVRTLTAEEETCLFGAHGQLGTRAETDKVYWQKVDLAYDWLAQHWNQEVPEGFTEDEASGRAEAKELNAKWRAEDPGIKNTPLFSEEPRDPVSHALQLEWRDSMRALGAIAHRPVVSTALLHTHNTLQNDPLRAQKLNYVLELIENFEADLIAGDFDKGGLSPGFKFPKPLEVYSQD
ncbi:MAG: hypothetical protein JWN82_116 [Candidatus Saccharibacteria bacterium]|nr:hypothetical protein [Candidatus Saccharibacteria bacterium]